MRAIFSLVALLVVVFIVMKLATTQLHALAPAAGGASQPTPAQAAADQVKDAIAKGAALRASEADSQ